MTIEEQCCCHNDPSIFMKVLYLLVNCVFIFAFFSPLFHTLCTIYFLRLHLYFLCLILHLCLFTWNRRAQFFCTCNSRDDDEMSQEPVSRRQRYSTCFFTTVMLAFKNSIFCVYFFFQQSLSILSIKVSHLGYCTYYIITYSRYLSKFQNRQNG